MGGNVQYINILEYTRAKPFLLVNRQTQPNPLRNGVDCRTYGRPLVLAVSVVPVRVSGFLFIFRFS
jgi:hypothetical protein